MSSDGSQWIQLITPSLHHPGSACALHHAQAAILFIQTNCDVCVSQCLQRLMRANVLPLYLSADLPRYRQHVHQLLAEVSLLATSGTGRSGPGSATELNVEQIVSKVTLRSP